VEQVRAETVGLSSGRLARIEAAVKRRMDRGELAGAISLVARKGKVAYFQCQGYADLEAKRQLAPDAILRMYSMSKPVTSAALLMLLEEGYFQLDDPVSAFIPEFAQCKVLTELTDSGPVLAELERPVSIRHLFTHTAGICYPNAEGSPAEKALALEAKDVSRMEDLTLEEVVGRLVRAPLAHQPGAGWTYGLSIDVLGRIVELISGKPFDVFLKERMFGPLHMVDTDFYVPPHKRGRLARVYGPGKSGGLELVEWATNAFWEKPRFLSGGGGLVSTAADYLRFAQMLVNGGELDGAQVLGRRTVRLMASCHIPQLMDQPAMKEGRAFGLGYTFGLGGRVFVDEAAGLHGSEGAYSWSGMASTTFWVDTKEELIGMFLPQLIPGPAGLHEQFQTLVYQALV